jgi:hypothetical protein
METSEQAIEIEAATEGMVLARDLLDNHGGVLLPAGASLTAASLNSLRRRGIEQLQVVAEAEPPDQEQLKAERERQCQRLERLFRHSAASGATGLLLARLTDYRKGG